MLNITNTTLSTLFSDIYRSLNLNQTPLDSPFRGPTLGDMSFF